MLRTGEDDYIYFLPDSGCYSTVGKLGGPQVLNHFILVKKNIKGVKVTLF